MPPLVEREVSLQAVPIVAGIDENGYGPIMGPLVATAVVVEVKSGASLRLNEFRKFGRVKIEDSKRVFRGGDRGRKKGEIIALAVLSQAGAKASDFPSLLDGVLVGGMKPLFSSCRGRPNFCFSKLALPVFADELTSAEEVKDLKGGLVRFVKVASSVACPWRFNTLLSRLQSKAMVDLFLFSELWESLPKGAEVYCGKVGSMRCYGLALEELGWKVEEALCEEAAESAYVIERAGKTLLLRFVKDADSEIFPVALASLVGKYIRELSMLSISRSLQRMIQEELKPVSGYREKYTLSLVDKLMAHRRRLGLPLECLLRAK